jgi:hypothetical protein
MGIIVMNAQLAKVKTDLGTLKGEETLSRAVKEVGLVTPLFSQR